MIRIAEANDIRHTANSFVEILRWRAEHEGTCPAYTFLVDGESDEVNVTYAELDHRAKAIGAWLQSFLEKGDRVLLLYHAGMEFITAYYGCLYAGMIAVPAYPPEKNRRLNRLQAIVDDAGAKVALTTTDVQPLVEAEQSIEVPVHATDLLGDEFAERWVDPQVGPDTIAYLQYSSGSTGNPKGVMVTQGNLLHNSNLIRDKMKHTKDEVGIAWVPIFHDLGLIAGILQPMYVGFYSVSFSPQKFVEKPMRWLEAFHNYRGTTTYGPNFALDLCVRKSTSEERARLDLSTWRNVLNASEPVRWSSLEKFTETFRECGFRAENHLPAWGLAEATLFISLVESGVAPVGKILDSKALEQGKLVFCDEPGEFTQYLVGNGKVGLDMEVAIVNPVTLTRCLPDEVGEIWAKGPSITLGYWGNPEKTKEDFHAYITDTGEGPFLRTGDLGFMADGEVFPAGRMKDLIIIRGKNHYPQDIEYTVEASHPLLREGCVAAFPLEVNEEERLVVVQEVRRHPEGAIDWDDLIATIRQRVAQEHGVQLYALVIIEQGAVLRTSSGKIQRRGTKAAWLEGKLKIVTEWKAELQEETEEKLNLRERILNAPESERLQAAQSAVLDLLGSVSGLKVTRDDAARTLPSLGVDSIASLQMKYQIEQELGVSLPFGLYVSNYTVEELIGHLFGQMEAAATSAGTMLVPTHNPRGGAEYRLTPGQEALWYLYQLAPENTAYNISSALRIDGALDTGALEAALLELVKRHEALRTTFGTYDGRPVQRVQQEAVFGFEQEDASRLNGQALQEKLAAAAHRPFDLENGPLLRVFLYAVGEDEHVLLLSMHHIVSDLWTVGVLIEELGRLYDAIRGATQLAGAASELTFRDYADWQQKWADSEQGLASATYWQERLQGELPALNLPTDRVRPAVQSFTGAAQFSVLDNELSDKLKNLARAHGATLYTVLLTAYSVLMARLSGQRDILIGSPTSGRSFATLSPVAGYFVNPVVIKAEVAEGTRFADLLESVKGTVADAFSHQEFPFPKLVELLKPERDASRSPIFQTMFVFEKSPTGDSGVAAMALGADDVPVQLGSLSARSVAIPERAAQFDLMMMTAELPDGLGVSLQYNTDLFDAATVERFSGQFRNLLTAIVERPEQEVGRLQLLTEAEEGLLEMWNQTAVEYALDQPLHELIALQAAKTPDAEAVVYDGQSLTYAELMRRANALASYLQAEGVGPDVRVGVCAERSLELVVALLGILQAGGAYVPLDPSYPQERLAFMVQDAQVPVLLTQAHLLAELPPHDAKAVQLDADWAKIDAFSGQEPLRSATPDSLAYMIYTSGSTGLPKGVLVPHRGIVNRLLWMQDAYRLTAADRVLQKTPFSFDVSVWEFFWPLLTGATLVMARPGGHQDPAYLAQVIEEQQVTTMHFVPSMLQAFLEGDEAGALPSLRQVMCSGEALSFDLQARFFARFDAELHNLYGPTEASVDVTSWACRREGEQKIVPIGRPIANIQIYILDANLQRVPIGVAGELCIGGVGLARGYLNRPELTAEKFIPHPFSTDQKARLYRTGDLARYLQDGTIEYLGRFDDQVKVRGFRIELGEIEATLAEHAAVREAVVAAREDKPGVKRLVAYLTLEPGQTVQTQELREFLKQRLPDYMVPAFFVTLDKMPLTPSGKADRKALPAPDQERTAAGALALPRTAGEKLLAGIWCEVLGLKEVGIRDNFYELGGDSILSLQIISRANRLGMRLTSKDFVEHPTVEELAGAAGETVAVQAEQGLVTGSMPLTPIQHWFFEQNLAEANRWNQSLLLELKRGLELEALERAVTAVIGHHDALRLRFVQEGAEWKQSHAPQVTEVPFAAYDLSAASTAEQDAGMKREMDRAENSLHLADGPMLRAVYFDLGRTRKPRLFLTVHHLVVDGVSWRILLEDLETALNHGALPEKTTSFKAWSTALGGYANSQELQAESGYWLSNDRSEATVLPKDHEGGRNTPDTLQELTVTLGAADTKALLTEAPGRYRAKIDELLLSALLKVVTGWSGQRSLRLNLEGHGREEILGGIDLSRTVGWFTTIYPVLLQKGNGDGVSDLLKGVKDQLRGVPNRGIGYGLLRYLQEEQDTAEKLAASPQAEICFNYLGQFDGMVSGSELYQAVLNFTGPSSTKNGMRRHLLELNCMVTDGELRAVFSYSNAVHETSTVEKLGQGFVAALADLTAAKADGAEILAPSDFPLAKLDQSGLNKVLSKLGKKKGR